MVEPVPYRRIDAQCKCVPPRTVPVRLAREVVALLASNRVPGDAVILTYKCRGCGLVHVTARQCRIAA